MEAEDWGVTKNLPMVVLAETPDPDSVPPTVVQVFPLSIWPEFASDLDLLVSGPPLPQPMTIEVWNEQPTLRGQLFRCFGALPAENLRRLADVASAVRAGTPAVADEHTGTTHCGAPLGGDDDPRRLFQQVELLRTLPLRVPALARLAQPSQLLLVDFEKELDRRRDAAMAAESCEPERSLHSVVLRSDSPPVRITVSECVCPEHLAIEVVEDPHGVTCGATVLGEAGVFLGVIPETRTVVVPWPGSSRLGIQLTNGRPLHLRKEG
jgi:hypothetical protein